MARVQQVTLRYTALVSFQEKPSGGLRRRLETRSQRALALKAQFPDASDHSSSRKFSYLRSRSRLPHRDERADRRALEIDADEFTFVRRFDYW